MDKFYGFGPVVIGFQDFPVCPDWPFRDWKLDPYQTNETNAHIWVAHTPGEISPHGVLLQQARSALSVREIWRLPDGAILWQQTQKDGKLLQFLWKENRICLTADTTDTCGMAALEALTFLVYPCMLNLNILTFHSVLLEQDARGVLVAAPSGVGKTTHARLWRDHKNALILNGDRSACYKTPAGWVGFGTPWCGTSGEHMNRQVPVKALVLLQQGKEDRVTPLSPSQALSGVLPLGVCPGWDREMPLQMLSLLDTFLKDIPVILLECTPTGHAVDVLSAYLEKL